MVQNKKFIMQRGYKKIIALMKFFDCLVKFWTLLYGPKKAQWSNSQKAKLIGFFQG